MVALVEGRGYGGLCFTRVLQNETKRYTHHRVDTRTSSRLSLAAEREEARRTVEFSPRVARYPRLYSHDDERSSDGTYFQKRLVMPPSLFSSCSLPSLLLYRYLYIITILFPPIFVFIEKWPNFYAKISFSFQLFLFFFFIS